GFGPWGAPRPCPPPSFACCRCSPPTCRSPRSPRRCSCPATPSSRRRLRSTGSWGFPPAARRSAGPVSWGSWRGDDLAFMPSGGWNRPVHEVEWWLGGERSCMGQTVRFEGILRRLAMIDEGFVEDEAGLGLGLAGTLTLDPKTAALLQVGYPWPSGHQRCAWSGVLLHHRVTAPYPSLRSADTDSPQGERADDEERGD